MTGIIRILEFKSDDQRDKKEESHPLAKDVDTVEVFLDQNKGCVTLPPGECAEFFLHESTYHITKVYSKIVRKDRYGVALRWSYTYFAKFAIDI